MSGGIDYIEAMAVPFATGCGRLDGDTALLLLIHEVGGCGAIVHLTHLVNFAGELENPLGGRGLARIDVGEDANVSV